MAFATVKPFVTLLPYQRHDVESNDRFRWNCWSRQTGKSFTKSLRRILRGLQRRRTQVFLSSGERQSRELMAKARQHCQALKIACDYYDDRFFAGTGCRQLEINLPNGVRIIGLPANPQTARGFTGDVFLDEFAMHSEDREIWGAMFPTLLRGQGELDIASTPKGRKNLFYELKNNDRFSTSVVTLRQAIDQGLDVGFDDVRRSMGDEELFRQEFMCEFLDESTAFLTYEQIAGCEDGGLRADVSVDELGERPGDLYLGVDVGRRRDLTVMWVFECGIRNGECGMEKDPAVTRDLRIEISNKDPALGRSMANQRCLAEVVTRGIFTLANAPFREQQSLMRELLKLRNVRRCCIDAGGLGMQLAESAVEEFGGHRVEPITFTTTLKSQLAGALRIAVENRRIRIPVDESLRNDWHSVERAITAGGHVRFEAARQEGSHADRFWAAALALHASEGGAGGFEATVVRPLAFARNGGW